MAGNYGGDTFESLSKHNNATGSAYKANVNRQKTRKWVEAKIQSYDGDDWGSEFDDEAEEEASVPAVPPKPAGPREPVQPMNLNLNHAPAMRPISPGSRSPVGQPPLHIDTHRGGQAAGAAAAIPQPTSAPLNTSGTPPAPPDRVSSPQPGPEASQSASSSTYSSRPGFAHSESSSVISPASQRRVASPPPQTAPAGAAPSRFPLRKETASQQDASDARPQPRTEPTPLSPQSAKSPTSPNKPLPFVRPADIYRRHMEQEKEKERQSMESNRRSMDSGAGRRSVGNIEQPVPEALPALSKSATFDQVSRLKDSVYGGTSPQAHSAQFESLGRPASSGSAGVTSLQREPAEIGLQEHEDQRRVSTSPKLPDLARMSAFGADLFGRPLNSPGLSSAQTSRRPVAGTDASEKPSEPSKPDRTGSSAPVQDPAIVAKPSENLTRAPELDGPLKPTSTDEPSAEQVKAPRPVLPGEWASESVSHPDVGSFDNAGVLPEASQRIVDSREVSPVSEIHDSEDVRIPPSGLHTPLDSSLEAGAAAAQPISPLPIPVGSTTDRVSAPIVTEDAAPPPPPPKDSMKSQTPGSVPTSATSEIAPTAPLNPVKGQTIQDFHAAQLRSIPSISTINNPSPIKESDKLREEIIRSLSPERLPQEYLAATGGGASGTAGKNNARESHYLSDVYDDYWSPEEEVPEQKSLPDVKLDRTTGQDEQSPLKEQSVPIPIAPPVVAPLTPRKDQAVVDEARPTLTRKFSWEMESEETNAAPGLNAGAQSAVHASGSEAVISPEPESTAALPTIDSEDSTPEPSGPDAQRLEVDVAGGNLSHRVSQASTSPPRPVSPKLEPPSPVSVMTDAAPPVAVSSSDDARRMSLAEEKSLLQTTSNPVSSTPPFAQHPALDQNETSPTGSAPTRLVEGRVNIMSFRQIMELPSAAERIQKYEETKEQFALIESGLGRWLSNMRAQVPEHANASASFQGILRNAPSQTGPTGPTGSATQPPYYQQYLSANASSSPAPGSQSGRPGGGIIPPSMQYSGADLRHSSGQVKAKGKEVLLAAGKAGKGLFSKGKNKLRGTGDKVFS